MYTYILDEQGNPQLTGDLYEWASWYSRVDQSVLSVDRTEIVRDRKVVATVETKFSGQVDCLTTPPLVWVTQVVGTCEVWRTDKREKAKSNHKRMVRMLENIYRK